MKILLVYPKYPDTFWSFKYALKFTPRKALNTPLGILTIGAMLPDEWEKKLDARQRELDITDKKVSQKLLKLEQAESTKISNLAKLYDGMDPRAVAKLIANLDDATVVSILPRMKLKNASTVLALMPAKRGARLSKKMITIAEK